ncbi:Hypothetical_protein [Hexamita inflata]|uniref:Hypothetical_protein n=1 Tax=Hexamita inflata TaxID=28002 RepID=A0AA86V6Q6_9EUKA|nr:Hypothetical protein HINF_LOCUS66241 [Hexamita inflata]
MKLYFDSTVSAGVAITIPPLHQLLVYVTDALLQMAASSFAESSTQRSRDRPIPSASATPGRYLSRTLFCIKSANARVKAGVEAVNATVLKRRTSVTLSEGCQFVVSPAQTEGQQRETEKKETRPAREHVPGHQFVQLVFNNKETPHERYQALAPKNLSSAASSRRDRPSNGSSQNCATNPGSLPRVYGFAREDSDELMYKWRPAANVAVSSAHTLLQFEIEYECRKALRNGQREKYKPFNA